MILYFTIFWLVAKLSFYMIFILFMTIFIQILVKFPDFYVREFTETNFMSLNFLKMV